MLFRSIFIFLIILIPKVYSNNQAKFKCKSNRGLIEWHYDNKYLYEVHAQDDVRKYEIEDKNNDKLFARSKSKNEVWYAVFDFNKRRIDVQGPYGQYSNTECEKTQ